MATIAFGLMALLYGPRAGGIFVLALVLTTLSAPVVIKAVIIQQLP
jgi:hypothetical protein